MPTIVIAAGGTAGHVVPALAVAAALRDSGAQVEFVGGERAEGARGVREADRAEAVGRLVVRQDDVTVGRGG